MYTGKGTGRGMDRGMEGWKGFAEREGKKGRKEEKERVRGVRVSGFSFRIGGFGFWILDTG